MFALLRLAFVVASVALAGCAGFANQNPMSERGTFVIDAPLFSESRVFFASGTTNESIVELIPQRFPPKDSDLLIHESEPLTVIVDSVTLPRTGIGNDPKDIAVIVDLSTALDGGYKSIVAWYETNVLPGRTLDFKNLVVHHEPRWDPRVAPFLRLRVIDVKLEQNERVRQALKQVQTFAPEIGNLIPYPGTSALIGIAAQAASLVLGNQANRTIMDYSFQFFGSDTIIRSGGAVAGSELAVLRRGSFLTLGLPKETDREFWSTCGTLKFDLDSRDLTFVTKEAPKQGGAAADKTTKLESPIVKLTLATAETVVPKIVVDRSAFLQQMFQRLAQDVRLEAIEQESAALATSVSNFVSAEQARRFRSKAAVKALMIKIKEADNVKNSEELFFMVRAISAIAKTDFGSREEAIEWWEKIGSVKESFR
ncbi:MAG: hypothetical protein CVU57_05245 [Deltaproteobacteria bacterium HGW-Deltaproteobacteria-15]|jgi:hypothetical protein|nr:MAG: hypothetical protein CVU57_05245 [Deltaproteobacteria bacterium HGW-Deltaproteobacteria-15]